MDADELYTIKNNFWLGNFEAAITEARSLKLRTEAAKAERDCYIYRSFIGLRKYKCVRGCVGALTLLTEAARSCRVPAGRAGMARTRLSASPPLHTRARYLTPQGRHRRDQG